MSTVRYKKTIEYIIPSLLVGMMFLCVLAVNGQWPFGKDTIDYYDMAQQAVPFYYHNHDELFGLKSFVFDWYTNLGRAIPGLSEPSLFDLLLYFVPRDRILESMSVLMTIKIMAAAFTMNLFVRYVNKDLPYIFRMMLAAGYGMCGFVLANYTIPQWIDMAVIVPLVLMFSQMALKTGRICGLAVSLFLIMLDDYYFSIQALMFIFLTGGAFCLLRFISDKRSGKKSGLYVWRFAAGVITGLGLSAFSWISDIAFNLTSARFESNAGDAGMLGFYTDLLKSIQPGYLSRWFSIFGLAFPAALVAIGIYRALRKKGYTDVIFWILCIFMVTAQLLLESIHLILHFGSYVNYPVRNGFMIYCIVAGIAAYSYRPENGRSTSNAAEHMILIAAGSVMALLLVVLARRIYTSHTGLSDHTVVIGGLVFMSVCAVLHFVLIAYKNARYRGFCICIWCAELLLFGMIMIGQPLYDSEYGSENEQEGEFIRITNDLVAGFGNSLETGQDAATFRIKNPDTSLNANYGMIMQRETLSGWTSFATQDQIDGAISLGYSSQFTRILDSGGTVFSDTLLHIRDIISHEELDDKLYEKVASADAVIDHMTGEKLGYKLYRNRFEMPFAIPVKDASKLEGTYDRVPDLINAYCEAFGGSPIASEITDTPDVKTVEGHEIYTYHIRADGRKTMYFCGDCVDCDYYNTSVAVNGKILTIASIKENDNNLFPAHFNNNTVLLGSFDDEDVDITIDMDISDPEKKYGFYLYRIDRRALADLCQGMPDGITVTQGKQSLAIDADLVDKKYTGVLVPVPYDNGWRAFVSGQNVDIKSINGLFMYIPFEGEGRSIYMSYCPPYMKPGFIIAAVSLILCIMLVIADNKKKPVAGMADKVLGYLYITAFGAALIVIYIVPIVFAVFKA